MTTADNFFKGVNEARPGTGINVEPGQYTVTILACKAVKKWNGENCFIVELGINESNNPSRPIDSKMSWVCNLTKHTSALGNVKEFLAQATGSRFEDITEEAAKGAVGETNPLKGTKLKLTAVRVPTKTAGGKFTKCVWSLAE